MVLNSGAVVQEGTHDELIAAGGEYARLFHLQAVRFSDDAVADQVVGR